ncbi:MAG: hypothetical protein RR470_08815 [Vagococcus sp.]|uniref:hypothetical protein n=1 Tax=Vagococcus sp. TaxID=1933889 RepID=UPI002FCA0D79
MKKLGVSILSGLLIITLAACKKEQSKEISSETEISTKHVYVTEDTSEAKRLIEEMVQQAKEDEKQRLAEKKQRIDSQEPLIQITGEVIDTLTKPDSGLDIYQITVMVKHIENDPNDLFKNGENKEYSFFVSPSEFKETAFKKIKKGTTIKIETFQDAYLTENPPQQISEEDVVGFEVMKE